MQKAEPGGSAFFKSEYKFDFRISERMNPFPTA